MSICISVASAFERLPCRHKRRGLDRAVGPGTKPGMRRECSSAGAVAPQPTLAFGGGAVAEASSSTASACVVVECSFPAMYPDHDPLQHHIGFASAASFM